MLSIKGNKIKTTFLKTSSRNFVGGYLYKIAKGKLKYFYIFKITSIKKIK